jgi:peroxiredoxin
LALSAFSQTSLKTGDDAPIFNSASLDGDYFNLQQKRGSVVVLTFWSTKSEICRKEIPQLNQFTSRYYGKNVVFLALTTENEDRIAPFLRSNPFKFMILPNSFGVILQYADRLKGGNLDMGFPAFYVIDQGGKLGYRGSGYDKTAPLAAAIDQLLAK